MTFAHYDPESFFDEMFEASRRRAAGRARARAVHRGAARRRAAAPPALGRARAAEHGHHVQRLRRRRRHREDLPVRPRPADRRRPPSGSTIERGLKQRIHALNLFIDDIYHEQQILKDGVVPRRRDRARPRRSAQQCVGLNPPRGIWCHITGTDLVRDRDGQIYVLEDNLRCPSGVSYVLENREVMKRTFPQVFEALADPAGRRLSRAGCCDMLSTSRRDGVESAACRGADAGHLQLGLLRALVPRPADGRGAGRGPRPGRVATASSTCGRRTGFERVDVIYRRIDDDFLDPDGVPRRLDARRAGPDGRLPRGPRGAGQRAGHGRRRRQGRLRLRAADHQVLPGRGHRSCRTCRPTSAPRTSDRELRARATSTSWW